MLYIISVPACGTSIHTKYCNFLLPHTTAKPLTFVKILRLLKLSLLSIFKVSSWLHSLSFIYLLQYLPPFFHVVPFTRINVDNSHLSYLCHGTLFLVYLFYICNGKDFKTFLNNFILPVYL